MHKSADVLQRERIIYDSCLDRKKWKANQEIYSISLFGKWLECIGK